LVCINSIDKFQEKDFKNTVIYIDEINSLLSYLLDSETLNNKRIPILNKLIEIIKTTDKMICTDADVSDLVFTFLNKLRPAEAMIYINNPFIACFNTVALLNYVYDRVFDESKVVYGLDYNLQKSDVYVFIDDRYRTINPVQVVQQLTRQRQIHDLYYCIDTAKSGPISFSILMRRESKQSMM